MNMEQIKSKLRSDEYDFLRTDENLGSNIIMLGLGGSHAYGTNTPDSDLDIRGCALNTKMQILTNERFDHFLDDKTDTTIYSFNKLIHLLCNVNPSTIEMLGLRKEHYLYLAPIGQEMIDNAHLFLSKRAANSFGGYASKKLRGINDKANKLVEKSEVNKLGKHMMHLIRLYIMGLDILENEKIVVYREKEHDFLMDIRDGKYIDGNQHPSLEFFEMVDEYEKRLGYAKEHTNLPDEPDYERINEFVASVNERVVKGEV